MHRCKTGWSFDHLIGASEQRQGHGKTECFRGLEVDNQLDFRGLLHRQIGRFLSFEHPTGIDADRPERICNTGTAAGRLENTLVAAGIKPDDIDAIILTHGHIDHLSGIMNDEGKRPNAQIIMSKVEHDFWTDEAKTSSTGVMKLLVDSARKNLLPNKERLVFVEDGKEAVKGVSVISTPGHTPGHTSYLLSSLLSSGGQNFIYTGDVVTHPAISLQYPNWVFNFDADPAIASDTRKRVLDMAAQDKLMLIGYHFAFPGIGNVAKEGDAYRFVPINMDV
jgi:glyoxylase-like metal-dependent hydrolase (beta-lactamase superfamily II)